MIANTSHVFPILVGAGRYVLLALSRSCDWLITGRFVQYQPERHYMRGPGPKWREKHGGLASS
jgi:hypothetical protein